MIICQKDHRFWILFSPLLVWHSFIHTNSLWILFRKHTFIGQNKTEGNSNIYNINKKGSPLGKGPIPSHAIIHFPGVYILLMTQQRWHIQHKFTQKNINREELGKVCNTNVVQFLESRLSVTYKQHLFLWVYIQEISKGSLW